MFDIAYRDVFDTARWGQICSYANGAIHAGRRGIPFDSASRG